jgi:hypothetical protein
MSGTAPIGETLAPGAAPPPGAVDGRVLHIAAPSDVTPTYAQPPISRQHYTMDWSAVLTSEITHSAWTASPALTITNQTQTTTTTGATLAAPTPGTWHQVTNIITTADGLTHHRSLFLLASLDLAAAAPSALFPSPIAAVAQLRRDRLLKLATTHLAGVSISDDECWKHLKAAEAEAERVLRTWLAPREVIPDHPDYDAEAAAAQAAGQRVHRDPGYDWGPHMMRGDKWALIEVRHRPLLSITYARFSYPSPLTGIAELPPDWFRIDSRAGTAQIVWSSSPNQFALNSFILSALSAGRLVPFMLHIRYRAGLANATDALPDLPSLVMRLATVHVVEDLLLPQSGSISADGLSRSLSMEASKHRDEVEDKLDAMRQAAEGIRFIMV